MDNQTQQLTTSIPHSHQKLYTALGLSIAAAALLLVIVLKTTYKTPKSFNSQGQTAQPDAIPTTKPISIETQIQQVSPVPITSKQSLNNEASTLDSVDTSQIEVGLEQNSKDTSSFDQ